MRVGEEGDIMKLNADIIYTQLRKTFPCEIYGYREEALTLRRPEFCVSETDTLKKGHLYLMTRDEFPRHIALEKGAVVVCSCKIPNFNYYQENCCFIKLDGKPNLFSVSNTLYAIFEKYSNWDHRLSDLLESSADIQEMTDCTSQLFDNPMLILDSCFHFIATAGYRGLEAGEKGFDRSGSNKLSMTALNQFLASMDLQVSKKEPLLLDVEGNHVLSLNLFERDEYAGSITLRYMKHLHEPGDEALMKHFAKYMMLAMKQYTTFMTSNKSQLRRAFKELVSNNSISPELWDSVQKLKVSGEWLCVVLQAYGSYSHLPLDYLSDQLEANFPDSLAFPHQDYIILFYNGENLGRKTDYSEKLEQGLSEFFGQQMMKVGISSSFTELTRAQIHYLQAVVALKNGTMLNPQEYYYYYQDYALTELVINAQNDMPLELFYSDGLKRLFEHDQTSSTSYLETLRSYLNNNMSASATAAELYIHRSTLLERLARIKRELWEDLDDPDVRLRLMIILKALEIKENMDSM